MHCEPQHPGGEGPAIIVGSAACWEDDLRQCQDAAGADATVIVLNAMARYLDHDILFSAHIELTERWAAMSVTADSEIHACRVDRRIVHPTHLALIDHIWKGAPLAGSSSLGAARAAVIMGFSPVLLAGCPMLPIGYARDYYHAAPPDSCPLHPEHGAYGEELIRNWQMKWRSEHEKGHLPAVYSASGFTRELLGWLPTPRTSPTRPSPFSARAGSAT